MLHKTVEGQEFGLLTDMMGTRVFRLNEDGTRKEIGEPHDVGRGNFRASTLFFVTQENGRRLGKSTFTACSSMDEAFETICKQHMDFLNGRVCEFCGTPDATTTSGHMICEDCHQDMFQ